ncbi:MAG: biopolymer transporter ExbD [Bacteroidales bacterium]
MRAKMPEMNTGSTADIAFLLLIFFMVTTTFESDRGLLRKLPEWEEIPKASEVNERNLLPVWINSHNLVMIRGKQLSIPEIREVVREFLQNPENRSDLPDKTLTAIGELGIFPVTRGVISIQNSRETSYETYIHVVSELESAGMELKNDFSRLHFGKNYSELDEAIQNLVRKACPCMISEAEPVGRGD